MANNIKYVYFFPAVDAGNPFKHMHIYERWVENVRSQGLSQEMVTFVRWTVKLKHSGKFEEYDDKDGLSIITTPPTIKLKRIWIILYFLFQSLRHDRIVVHVRKMPVTQLAAVKQIVGDRLKIVLELEGDSVAEKKYDERQSEPVERLEKIRPVQSEQLFELSMSDHVLTMTDKMRQTLIDRYSIEDIENKITAIPTDFPREVGFYKSKRDGTRKKYGMEGKFVYAYIGSASLDWQNINRTLEIFSILQEELELDLFLLLLIHESDHNIVQSKIAQIGISDKDYLLTEVPHKDVKSYLYAADIGVMLREDYLMCEVVYGTKYLDYLAAGLPVLTTKVATWSTEINDKEFGIVLSDMSDDDEIINKFKQFFQYKQKKRSDISQWAEKKFNLTPYVVNYNKIIRKIGNQ